MARRVKIRNFPVKLKKNDIAEILEAKYSSAGYQVTKRTLSVKVRMSAFIAARVQPHGNWVNNDVDIYVRGYTPNFGARVIERLLLFLPWIYMWLQRRKFVTEITEYLRSDEFINDARRHVGS
jgi:hypothetical protein